MTESKRTPNNNTTLSSDGLKRTIGVLGLSAIIMYATVAFLLAAIGGFQVLAVATSAAILLVYLGVALAVCGGANCRSRDKNQISFRA